MKTKIFPYMLFLPALILVLTGCRKQDEFGSIVIDGTKPKAGFTYVANTMTVTLTNTSQDAESYYWDFGDGTSSTEQSPVHIYTLAGFYTISLKVNSTAGYSDMFVGEPVYVAGKLEAAFSSMPELGLRVAFDARSSLNIKTAEWDFGDGAKGEGLTVSHTFLAEGKYAVTLKATGLLEGDEETTSQVITVFKNMNLLKASGMGKDAGDHWIIMLDGMPVKYGFTDDGPSTSATPEDGCLCFGGITGNSGSLVYQGVPVDAGKKYKLSAQVKAPAGGRKAFLQFYVAPNASSASDFIESNGNPLTNHYLALNTWNGWGSNDTSVAVDGDMYEICQWNGRFGLGARNGGIYEATETTTVYVGIRTLTQEGIGDILVDDVYFELQDE
jgi:PKD repeat protein